MSCNNNESRILHIGFIESQFSTFSFSFEDWGQWLALWWFFIQGHLKKWWLRYFRSALEIEVSSSSTAMYGWMEAFEHWRTSRVCGRAVFEQASRVEQWRRPVYHQLVVAFSSRKHWVPFRAPRAWQEASSRVTSRQARLDSPRPWLSEFLKIHLSNLKYGLIYPYGALDTPPESTHAHVDERVDHRRSPDQKVLRLQKTSAEVSWWFLKSTRRLFQIIFSLCSKELSIFRNNMLYFRQSFLENSDKLRWPPA